MVLQRLPLLRLEPGGIRLGRAAQVVLEEQVEHQHEKLVRVVHLAELHVLLRHRTLDERARLQRRAAIVAVVLRRKLRELA
eukprot:1781475-Prymnesium_polylepis.1